MKDHPRIFVLEDHSRFGGLGEFLMYEMTKANLLEHNNFIIYAIDGFPACGSPAEALNFHGLDGQSLEKRIKTTIHVK
jgi:transketolase